MIKHQTQLLYNSCVSTCIAMLLDVPQEKVIEEFHEDYHNRRKQVLTYMHEKGCELVPGKIDTHIYFGQLCLVAVPSLNIPGGTHQIIVDARDGKCLIYDPNEGLEGRKFYSRDEKAGAIDLVSYHIDYMMHWCPVMGEKPDVYYSC